MEKYQLYSLQPSVHIQLPMQYTKLFLCRFFFIIYVFIFYFLFSILSSLILATTPSFLALTSSLFMNTVYKNYIFLNFHCQYCPKEATNFLYFLSYTEKTEILSVQYKKYFCFYIFSCNICFFNFKSTALHPQKRKTDTALLPLLHMRAVHALWYSRKRPA